MPSSGAVRLIPALASDTAPARAVQQLREAGFSEDDAFHLRAVSSLIGPEVDRIVAAFGDRLRVRPTDDERCIVGAIELELHAVLELLCSGRCDEELFRRAVRIAAGCEEQRIDRARALAAFTALRLDLDRVIRARLPHEANTVRGALGKVFDALIVAFVEGCEAVAKRDATSSSLDAESAREQAKLASIGTLAAGLAHEIRNPLNGAELHASFVERALRRSGGSPEVFEALSVVRAEIKRLAQLVTEFLEFARPMPLVLGATSVEALCQRAAQLVRHEMGVAPVELVVDVDRGDNFIRADEERLLQMLVNLLRNAVEAVTSVGGGAVTLRAGAEGDRMFFDVEDDGPGIAGPTSPIFDAFYTTKASGTGLGLAIVHRTVTDHHGTISASSDSGRTVFRIILPLEPAAAG